MLARAVAWIREQFAFLLVLVGLALAFGYLLVDPGRWSRSTGIMAVSVLLAGVLRMTLPTGLVGSLAVRGRMFDTAGYLLLGALMLVVDIRLHS